MRRCARACSATGHVFRSETDTEVLAHLIEAHYEGDLVAAVRATLAEVRGAFALGVISSDSPGRLIFARNGATPLIVGLGDQRDVRRLRHPGDAAVHAPHRRAAGG